MVNCARSEIFASDNHLIFVYSILEVYLFSEGNKDMRNLLGGKGANLAEMTGLGLPVPQGFTITTEACTQYYEDGRKINDEIQEQIMFPSVRVRALLCPV